MQYPSLWKTPMRIIAVSSRTAVASTPAAAAPLSLGPDGSS